MPLLWWTKIPKSVASCINKLIHINRIKHLLDKETLLFIINSVFFSRLFYCSSFWSNTSATNTNKLRFVKHFAAILGLRKYDHISAGLRSLRSLMSNKDLWSMMQLWCINVSKVCHLPSYPSDKFSTRAIIHDRQTRYRDNLNIPSCKINACQRAFITMV